MADKSKKSERRSGSERRGLVDTDISTGGAFPNETLPLEGLFVAHYTAMGLKGTAWVPQATVVEAQFHHGGKVNGKIRRNDGGTFSSYFDFSGTYNVQHDELGPISGKAYFDLLDNTSGISFRRQELFIVKRNVFEIFFFLANSYAIKRLYPPDILHPPHIFYEPVVTNATVEGVFYRVE